MAGQSAFGTSFKITSGGSLVAVGELTGIGGPSLSVDTIDVSSHTSADAHREFVAGVIDAGEMALEGNLLQGNAELLKDSIESRAVVAAEVNFPPYLTAPDTYKFSKWGFSGIVIGLGPTAPHDGKLGFNGSVKVTGATDLSEADIWIITFTVDDGVDPVAGASVQIYADAGRTELVGWPRLTNTAGEVQFLLVNGTYYYTVSKTGFTPEEDSILVDGANDTEPVTLGP
jgi:hypothetical protein